MAENGLGKAIETTGWLTGLPITVVGTALNVAQGVSDAAVVASATKTGAGFTLSPDEARSLLDRAKRLRENVAKMQPDAQALARLTPPSPDPGSAGFNQQAVTTFSTGRDSLDAMLRYVTELIGRLEKALGIVSESDGQAAVDVKAVGNSEQGKGLLG
ncbi:hypothetical protein [Amycolatopsis rubida]|uniref:PE family protein n=1 Tax=Amycolatopsis rubida TaxID=112413 RepID=A0A1I5XV90_9PSEU|nr:hypothetical protein [Amycolatopsis rubida]SFQ35911.1 hypothetical protein SAMN05421854_11159 [Amycolatopsis rubida]